MCRMLKASIKIRTKEGTRRQRKGSIKGSRRKVKGGRGRAVTGGEGGQGEREPKEGGS